MTVSVGPALPGSTTAYASAEQPAGAGKGGNSDFGDMVDGGRSTQPDKQQPSAVTPRESRWAGLPTRLAGADGKGEPEHPGATKHRSAKTPATKAVKEDADGKPDKASADVEQAGQSAPPLQDQLPLLMALHDISHFSASAKAAGQNKRDPAGDELQENQQLSSPKNYRAGADVLEATSRSERILMPAGFLMEHQGQQPSGSELAAAVSRPQGDPASRSSVDQPTIDAPGSRTSQVERQAFSGGRVDVVAEQSFPAPAQNAMSQAATAVVSAIASDSGLRQAFSTPSSTSQTASSVAVPTHILKIELHPAELGVVTASLRLAGEQLSIELKPESHEAYRRLTADSEAIVKSLRGLGFDVDKVTILQPSIAVPSLVRTDASGSLQTSTGREQSSFQPGNSSGNNGGSGGQQPGRNRNDDAQDFGRAAPHSRDRAGDDIFI